MNKLATAFLYLLSVILILISVWTVYTIVFENEENTCSMTFMFQMPQYKPIGLSYEERKSFPHYRIYLYDEGDSLDLSNLRGIPILFIPGNGGSHRQARSLGSVLLRMAESRRTPFHFNVFAADFNEELTAIHGFYIQKETEFITICMRKIFHLYRGRKNPPKKIILVGHSMGGFVARNILMNDSFDGSTVDFIITLSTPHLSPAFLGEKSLMRQYAHINKFWRQSLKQQRSTEDGEVAKDNVLTVKKPLNGNNSLHVSEIALISLSGGLRDFQVWDGSADVTALETGDPSVSLWLSTEWIRGSWSSADHLCILWCKEIVMALSRSLFDIAAVETSGTTLQPQEKVNIFRNRMVTKAMPSFENLPSPPKSNYHWMNYTIDKNYFQLRLDETMKPTYVKMGPISIHPGVVIHVTASVIRHLSWIMVCFTGECRDMFDVKSHARDIPPFNVNKKLLTLSYEMLRQLANHSINSPPPTEVFIVLNFPQHKYPLNLQLSVNPTEMASQLRLYPGQGHQVMNIHSGGHVWTLELPYLKWIAHEISLKVPINAIEHQQILPESSSTEHVLLLHEDPWRNEISLWTSLLTVPDVRTDVKTVRVVSYHPQSSSKVILVLPMRGIEEIQVSTDFAPVAMVAHIFRSLGPLYIPLFIILITGQQSLMFYVAWPQERHYLRIIHMIGLSVLIPMLWPNNLNANGKNTPIPWHQMILLYAVAFSMVNLTTLFLKVLHGIGWLGYKIENSIPHLIERIYHFILLAQLILFVPLSVILAYMGHLCFSYLLSTILYLKFFLFSTRISSQRKNSLILLVVLQFLCYGPDFIVWLKYYLQQRGSRHAAFDPATSLGNQLLGFISPFGPDYEGIFFLLINVIAITVLHITRSRLLLREDQIIRNQFYHSYNCVLVLIPYVYICIRSQLSLTICGQFISLILLLESIQPLLLFKVCKSQK